MKRSGSGAGSRSVRRGRGVARRGRAAAELAETGLPDGVTGALIDTYGFPGAPAGQVFADLAVAIADGADAVSGSRSARPAGAVRRWPRCPRRGGCWTGCDRAAPGAGAGGAGGGRRARLGGGARRRMRGWRSCGSTSTPRTSTSCCTPRACSRPRPRRRCGCSPQPGAAQHRADDRPLRHRLSADSGPVGGLPAENARSRLTTPRCGRWRTCSASCSGETWSATIRASIRCACRPRWPPDGSSGSG